MSDREQTIAGLRELADFLEANPDLPVHAARIDFSVDVQRPVTDRRPEVERIAAILGVDPVDDAHYVAERNFGGAIYIAASCNPGPKQGLCVACRANPVRRPDAGDHLAARLCTPCLGDQADLIDPQGGAS